MVICMTVENSIRVSTQGKIRRARLVFVMLASAGILLLIGINDMQQSSASNQYGILGRQAPAFGLNTWIDGNGNPMDPIEVVDYRGKVIYLYFFQDW